MLTHPLAGLQAARFYTASILIAVEALWDRNVGPISNWAGWFLGAEKKHDVKLVGWMKTGGF